MAVVCYVVVLLAFMQLVEVSNMMRRSTRRTMGKFTHTLDIEAFLTWFSFPMLLWAALLELVIFHMASQARLDPVLNKLAL